MARYRKKKLYRRNGFTKKKYWVKRSRVGRRRYKKYTTKRGTASRLKLPAGWPKDQKSRTTLRAIKIPFFSSVPKQFNSHIVHEVTIDIDDMKKYCQEMAWFKYYRIRTVRLKLWDLYPVKMGNVVYENELIK